MCVSPAKALFVSTACRTIPVVELFPKKRGATWSLCSYRDVSGESATSSSLDSASIWSWAVTRIGCDAEGGKSCS
jgi:hypothetical protein